MSNESSTPIPSTGCCPPFDPTPWEDCELHWDSKTFLRDRVRSFLHIPLNYGTVMCRNLPRITEDFTIRRLVLTEENSLWGAHLYFETDGPVEGGANCTLTGTFRTKVFEGPYKQVGHWIRAFRHELEAQGKPVNRMFAYYTTCPKCAKAYGKNYTVLFAMV